MQGVIKNNVIENWISDIWKLAKELKGIVHNNLFGNFQSVYMGFLKNLFFLFKTAVFKYLNSNKKLENDLKNLIKMTHFLIELIYKKPYVEFYGIQMKFLWILESTTYSIICFKDLRIHLCCMSEGKASYSLLRTISCSGMTKLYISFVKLILDIDFKWEKSVFKFVSDDWWKIRCVYTLCWLLYIIQEWEIL